MKRTGCAFLILVLIVLVPITTPANAAVWPTFSLTATVTGVPYGTDPYGEFLDVGDKSTLTGSYNDTLLSGSGDGTLYCGASPDQCSWEWDILGFKGITIVDYEYEAYIRSLGWPTLTFENGEVVGLGATAILADGFEGIYLHSNGLNWQLNQTGVGTVYEGVWSVAPVPIPTTLILLGSGILGLAGFRRKIKN